MSGTSPSKLTRPNILAGNGGRQFSFGGRPLHERQKSSPVVQKQDVTPQGTTAAPLSTPDSEDSSKSPFTYALHVVFTSFVRVAEKKINTLVGQANEPEPQINAVLGEGADPSFDKVLRSLGYIARQNPKPVIDSVMFWRKSRAELKSETQPGFTGAQANGLQLPSTPAPAPALQRRPTDVSRPPFQRSPVSLSNTTQADYIRDQASILTDRKSLLSIFILCRTLIEIIKQLSADSLTDEVGEKLEEIVFNQLKNADYESLHSSSLRKANWELFSELLGCLSSIRFASVSDKFIADLEKFGHGSLTKDREPRVEMVIHGMRHLRIKTFPVLALEESAEFLSSLARFFLDAHGFRVKQAYALVLHEMVLPLAGVSIQIWLYKLMRQTATAEFNFPTWSQMVRMVFPRALKLLEKARYWNVAFQLAITILTVAPRDLFVDRWYSFLEQNLNKLKDKTSRVLVTDSIARMTWVSVFRCPEPQQSNSKKVVSILRNFFPSGRRLGYSDIPLSPLAHALRFLAARHSELCFANFIIPLIGADHLNGDRVIPLEDVSPEKIIIALNAFIMILDDFEHSTQPQFPVQFASFESQGNILQSRIRSRTPALQALSENISKYVYRLALACDQHLCIPVQDEKNVAPLRTTAFQIDGSNNTLMRERHLYVDLYALVLGSIPSLVSSEALQLRLIAPACRAITNADKGIRLAARKTIRRMATSSRIQAVVVGYAKSVLSSDFDSTEESLEILTLYTYLLECWADWLSNRHAPQDSASFARQSPNDEKADEIESASIWTTIEEVEAHGLYFLCSRSQAIRTFAVQILQLVKQLDSITESQSHKSDSSHSKKSSKSSIDPGMLRIVDVLQTLGSDSLRAAQSSASTAEKVRISKLAAEHPEEALITLACSESTIDVAIWLKVFSQVILAAFTRCPIAVAICRNLVCNRLLAMHPQVLSFYESTRTQPMEIPARVNPRPSIAGDTLIEQWRLYLIVACATLTHTEEQPPTHFVRHGRKRSMPVAMFQQITSAKTVFQLVLPFLAADHALLREAVIGSLGCINVNLLGLLLRDLQPFFAVIANANRSRTDEKTTRDSKRLDHLRIGISNILRLTMPLLAGNDITSDPWLWSTIMTFLKEVKIFLADEAVQTNWQYQRLRQCFCGLLESVWEALVENAMAERCLPFESRLSYFRTVEEWCNHGPQQSINKRRAEVMFQAILTANRDSRDRGALAAAMELEKRNTEFAALSAMAALCRGPMTRPHDNSVGAEAARTFDLEGLFSWIDTVLNSTNERVSVQGRRALVNILEYNTDSVFVGKAINQSLTHCGPSQAAEQFFVALSEVLLKSQFKSCSMRQIVVLCICKAGDYNVSVRSSSLELLSAAELKFTNVTCIEPYIAAVANQNSIIYKQGQVALAAQLAKQHATSTLAIFSECCRILPLVDQSLRKAVMTIMLPFMGNIELQLDVDGQDLDPSSHMVLVNLIEVTIKYGSVMMEEIEALWTALVSGPFAGNVKAILDFTMNQSMARREPALVLCGKQIIVCLSRCPAGAKLAEALLAYMHPRSMIPQLKEPLRVASDEQAFTYAANLDLLFPVQQKHVVFSLGQMALIFLVDLLVIPTPDILSHSSSLLLVSLITMDHYIPLVQEQAKELYLYLSYNACVRSAQSEAQRTEAMAYLHTIRKSTRKTLWGYEEMASSSHLAASPKKSPLAMIEMVDRTLAIYQDQSPMLRQEWAETALVWATSCPVRHMACRAFQVYRCLSTGFTQLNLADMLARLSNTVADSSADIQTFAMEILSTLNLLIKNMAPDDLCTYPQLFWCTVACLDTIHEAEFCEALDMMENIMRKCDVLQPEVANVLLTAFPSRWESKFEGCFSSVLKGLRSDKSMHQSLELINRLMALPESELVGSTSRLLFAILSNLPFFVHSLSEEGQMNDANNRVALQIAEMADNQGLSGISRAFQAFARSKFKSADEFIRQTTSLIRDAYFPQWEAQVLVFLLGLLSNRQRWMKLSTMEILKCVLPFVDTRRVEFAGVGADLISPLLRLLQTEYAQEALEVLDRAISIAGGTKDRQVLRMSLGNRTIRKEYEKTATLFGIPEDSGWAVPMPIANAIRTRNNVHAVFYTCAQTSSSQLTADHVQFSMEDYAYQTPSDRSETMQSIDGGESTLGDMVSALHNLDVFFAEDVDSSAKPAMAFADSVSEQAPASVYDSRVAAILSRSLARSPSVSSFTSPGFDTSPKHERAHNVVDRNPISPLASGFSFPDNARSPVSPRSLKSPILSRNSESDRDAEAPQETVIQDDKSEASFKLESQLKHSVTTSMRSKLWSSKDPDRLREKEKKKVKVSTKVIKPSRHTDGPAPGSPSTDKGHFWSSRKEVKHNE